MQSTHLKTISEAGDDVLSDANVVQEFENVAIQGPNCYRRPRTMSLPTIYRDGSYLRIKRATNTPISCQKRRYSEPAGFATQQVIHRLSLRSNDSYSVRDESENGSCKRRSVKSLEAACSSRGSSLQSLSTPRRHSDPMYYVTENVKKLGMSQEGRSRSSKKVAPGEVSYCGNKPQPRTDDEHSGPRVSRRRKSSLVPVPFSSPIQEKQKARHDHDKSSSRPLSFPPSRKESKRHFRLPALDLKITFLTRQSTNISSANENSVIDLDVNNNSQGQVEEKALEGDESAKDLEDKYTANEDILVQWMKFFG